jgi:hypothetical protein
MQNKFFSICTVAMFGVMGLVVAVNPAKAVECVTRDTGGVSEAVCVDENGNAAYAAVDDEGNKVVLDSNGNYEIEIKH